MRRDKLSPSNAVLMSVLAFVLGVLMLSGLTLNAFAEPKAEPGTPVDVHLCDVDEHNCVLCLSVVTPFEKRAYGQIIPFERKLVTVDTIKLPKREKKVEPVKTKKTTSASKSESKKSVGKYSAEEMKMLYRVVEAEVGNESKLSKKYSTWVVMNRVNSKRYPNTIKGVIFQRGQYSTTLKGHGYWTKTPSKSTIAAVNEAVREGVQIPSDIFYADGYVHKGQVKYRKIDKTYYCRDKK